MSSDQSTWRLSIFFDNEECLLKLLSSYYLEFKLSPNFLKGSQVGACMLLTVMIFAGKLRLEGAIGPDSN